MTTLLYRDKFRRLFSDIRFWILLFILIRLVGITNAPLEIGHNWRQSLTNMIARNFLEGNPNLFYPQIDMAGNKSGFIGSEFPLFNYLTYQFSNLFGYSHWYGRLINLLISSTGIYYFYRLIEKICTKRIAFNAAIVLLCSIWFSFSRKIMPDTFSVSLVLIGLFFCYQYLTNNSRFNLFLFFVFITMGVLCKIPALSLLSVLGVLLIVKDVPARRKIIVFGTASIGITLVCLWYFYWVPHLVSTYGYQLYFPKSLTEGLNEIIPLLPEFAERFYFSSLHSYISFTFFLVGLFFLFRIKNHSLKIGLLFITTTFFLFILKTGAVFPLHNYYIIPFTPVMALIVGIGISKIQLKYQTVFLVLIAIEGIGNQQHDFFIKDSEKHKLTLETIINCNINKKGLIVINGGQSPQEIYFAHRKGWTVNDDDLIKEKLDSLHNSGASHLVINRKFTAKVIDYYPIIYSDTNYLVYKMDSRW